jgi:hypothetical protein
VALLRGDRPRCCRENSTHFTANQIGHSLRQRLRLSSVLGREVFAFYVAQFSHAPLEGRIQMGRIRYLGQIADHRHLRLLGASRERPCC